MKVSRITRVNARIITIYENYTLSDNSCGLNTHISDNINVCVILEEKDIDNYPSSTYMDNETKIEKHRIDITLFPVLNKFTLPYLYEGRDLLQVLPNYVRRSKIIHRYVEFFS